MSGDDLVAQLLQSAAVAQLGKAFLLHDRSGGLTAGEHLRENFLRLPTADPSFLYQSEQFIQGGGRKRALLDC